jgi:hypothetical protein
VLVLDNFFILSSRVSILSFLKKVLQCGKGITLVSTSIDLCGAF